MKGSMEGSLTRPPNPDPPFLALHQASFGGDTPYQVMFGPDVCGSTQRTHVIFNYPAAKSEEKNLLIKRDVPTRVDQLSHLYTLHVMANNSFNVLIDGESVRFGNLEEEWDFLAPKKIKDPAVSKPADWVDEEMVRACVFMGGVCVNGPRQHFIFYIHLPQPRPQMDDPEDKKPDGWDDIPAQIQDPEAKKPEDWDDDEDGEWTAPMIDNPEFMGEWKPKRITNPAYKGVWEHPEVCREGYWANDRMGREATGCLMWDSRRCIHAPPHTDRQPRVQAGPEAPRARQGRVLHRLRALAGQGRDAL